MPKPPFSQDVRVALAPPREKIEFDGERCSPWVKAPIWAEHLHRYLNVLPFCAGKRVLDIACGEGYGSALMARSGAAHVTGVDFSENIVTRARRIYAQETLVFQPGDITKPLPFPEDSFDIIVCFETIEHVREQPAAIAELRRLLTPDGVLVISTPDRLHPHAQSNTNVFHEKELDEDEFRALLTPHFSHIRACYQRNITGSVIVDEDGGFGEHTEFWERDGFVEYVSTPVLPQAKYIILWASDIALPRPRSGVLQDGVLNTLINQTIQRDGWT